MKSLALLLSVLAFTTLCAVEENCHCTDCKCTAEMNCGCKDGAGCDCPKNCTDCFAHDHEGEDDEADEEEDV